MTPRLIRSGHRRDGKSPCPEPPTASCHLISLHRYKYINVWLHNIVHLYITGIHHYTAINHCTSAQLYSTVRPSSNTSIYSYSALLLVGTHSLPCLSSLLSQAHITAPLNCTVLYCTVLYCTALYCSAQCSVYCICIRTRGGIYGQIYPFAWRISRGRSPRELLKAKGYIWPLSQVES